MLAREFGAKALDWSQIPSSEHDALIHCTPLGSLAQPGLTPIPADWIRAGTLVIDAIYRPRDTALLQAARARGAHTIAGGEWFVEQAAAQFELFHARPADRARLHATLEHMLAGSHAARPIALIGMRASGKTSVGIALAAVLGCPFIDLDRELEREYLARTARPLRAGEVLARDGEAHFRDLEQEVLARELALPAPRVLATGGGVVERATNRELLGRSATCVWLSVPPAELARRLRADPTPRPALVGTDPAAEVSTLLARREEWYQSLAQVVVDVSQATPTELAWCVAVELDLQSKP